MNELEQNPPRCVCKCEPYWLPVRDQWSDLVHSVDWSCGNCLRPARFVGHEGGAAFVVPRDAVRQLPAKVEGYINGSLLLTFKKNAERLEELRSDYEWTQYRKVCAKLGISPQQDWRRLAEARQPELNGFTASIYTEAWLHPPNFKPVPLTVPNHVLLYVAGRTAPKKGHSKSYWLVFEPKYIS